MLKPIYFTFIVWGEEHGDYFLNYCLPSLISPNNLPSLKLKRENKIIICVDEALWLKITQTKIFEEVNKYVEFIHFFIEPSKNSYTHHTYHMKYLSPYMQERGVYGCHMAPDVIVADGSLKYLESVIEQGYEIVLAQIPLRVNPTYLDKLRTRKIIQDESWPYSQSGHALNIHPRQVVDIIFDDLHFEALGWQWGTEQFHSYPVGIWWKIPRERGYVFHCLNWIRVALDYSKASPINVEDGVDGMDGFYVNTYFYKNVSKDKIHVIKDSDNFMMASWCDYSVGIPVPKDTRLKSRFRGFCYRVKAISSAYRNKAHICDQKRDFFHVQTYAHADNFNSNWVYTCIKARFIIFCVENRFAFFLVHFLEKLTDALYYVCNIRLFYKKIFNKFKFVLKSIFIKLTAKMRT